MREPGVDNYKKLEMVMKYTQGTMGILRILSMDKYEYIIWNVDASFVVHKDMSSHTCGFVTIVTNRAYVQYRNKKLNTNILTEAKLVGVDDVLT